MQTLIILVISLISLIRSEPNTEYTIRTIPNVNYQNIWVAPEGASFPFHVKGCKDARVALTSHPWEISSDSYEIGIGSPVNSRSYIMEHLNNTKISTNNDEDGYLHCNEFRRFWITWQDRKIQVGKGAIGNGVFLDSNKPVANDINMLSLASNDDNDVYWKFREYAVRGVSINTPSSYGYGALWKSTNSTDRIVFGVRACSDAHVILTKVLSDPNTDNVEIVIGGANNTRSMIKDARTNKVHVWRRSNYLNCNYVRTFWVKWNDTTGWVWVGRGPYVGKHEVMKWKTPKPFPVQGLGITSGFNFTALWQLSHIEGNQITTMTDATAKPTFKNPWILIDHKKVFEFYFRVRACSDAHVLLAKTAGNTTDANYQLRIGTHGNTRISILKNGTEVAARNISNTLSCQQFRSFWIHWKNHIIDIGSETTRYLSWKDASTKPGPPEIKAIALSTANNVRGSWEFRPAKEDHVRSMTPATPGKIEFGRTWVSTIGESFLTFKIKTCKDAHLVLTEIPRNPKINAYHIIIGGWNNKRSVIRRGVGMVGFNAVSNVHNLLDCKKPRDFWVSWFDGTIKVGTGLKIWEHRLMTFKDKQPFSVSSLGIASRDSEADWEFVELGSQELGEGKKEHHGIGGTFTMGGAIAFELCGLAIIIGITFLWIFIGGKIRHGDPSNPAIAAINNFNEKASDKIASMKASVGSAKDKLKNRMKSSDDPDKYGKM